MLREALTQHFQAPMQNMSFLSYLSYLNSAGKITQRSLLELVIMLCEQVEILEKKDEQYVKNFQDIEEVLGKLVSKSMPQSDSEVMASQDNAPESPTGSVAVDGAFPCDQCDKVVKTRLALAGHKKSHK